VTALRRLAWGGVGLGALLYGGSIAWLRANEAALVFQPEAYGGRAAEPPAPGLRPEAVTVPSSDGARLSAWVLRAADPGGPWVLLCHGNAGNLSLPRRQRFYRDLTAAGLNVVAFDYRGYGASSDVPPTERGVYDDAEAAYRFLVDSLGAPPSRVVLYGHSLGGGVASHLAVTVPAAGLVLEGTFTSVPDLGGERYPLLPVRALARHRFDNADRVRRMPLPLLLLHARADGTVPFTHAERLAALAPAGTRLVDLAGDHDSAWEADRDRYMAAFTAFAFRVTGGTSGR
jgi:uncharacterized protein